MSQNSTDETERPTKPRPPSWPRAVWEFLRNTWRGLTSMRTALVLLFLLALAAVPGALLPQRSIDPSQTKGYLADHSTIGPWLDKIGMFEVFASPWFAAIYILLFVSLVGCLGPRIFDYAKQLRARPVRTPRNLRRMPHYAETTTTEDADAVLSRARQKLRRWRTVEHTAEDGTRTISAERGYLREFGNLVFHFSLLAILVALALGKMFGYEGNVIVLNGSQFCNSGTYAYDSFRPGLRVDGTSLTPFCLKVNHIEASFTPNGEPLHYGTDLQYQSGQDLATDSWKPYPLKVNDPLRTQGVRVYMLGNGYAPQFTVTFPNGQTRTGEVQWQPVDPQTQLSSGATKFDPPGVTDPVKRRQKQLAVTGLFAPTARYNGGALQSGFPDLRNPAAAVNVMQGDLGTDSGRGQSIFSVDQKMVDSGRLNTVAQKNLALGQSVTLPDGTKVQFSGVKRWVNLQVSHDPTQIWVLGFAIAIVAGLSMSLMIKRRRLWIRISPANAAGDGDEPSRIVVEIGGLARTDQAGYGEEFTRLSAELLGDGVERATGSDDTQARQVREDGADEDQDDPAGEHLADEQADPTSGRNG